MSDGQKPRPPGGWLARLGASLKGTLEYAEVGRGVVTDVHLSRALPRFFASMRGRQSPVLLDLGPVIGQNVELLGDLLGCKVYIENVFGDPERAASDRRESAVRAELSTRFDHPSDSVDGVLCWDVLDYLSPAAAGQLVAELARLLKPGGCGMAIFSTLRADAGHYRKYVMVDERHLRHRSYPATQGPIRLWSGREIQMLFSAGIEADESFLLTHRQRELLFHKPMTAPV